MLPASSSSTRFHRSALLALSTSILVGAAGCPSDPQVEPDPDAPPTDGPPIDTPPPAVWSRLTPDGGAEPPFGGAIAADGDTLIVGGGWAADADDPAYIYVKTADGSWHEQARVPAAPFARSFGRRVAISGDTAVITGSTGEGDGPDSFHIYVLQRQGDAWAPAGIFDAGALFGGVAIDGDTIAVGEGTAGVRFFVRDAGLWTDLGSQPPPVEDPGFLFAENLALDGDTLLVGDRLGHHATEDADTGLVHVYVRHGVRWTFESTLAPTFDNVAAQDIGFGSSVALRGDRAVIGVSHDAPCSYALVYQRSGAAWSRSARIDSGHNVCGDIASLAVTLGDDVIALGAGGYGGDFPSSGAVYVHQLVGGVWTARSPGALPIVATEAGSALALTSTDVLIGAPAHGTVFAHPLLP